MERIGASDSRLKDTNKVKDHAIYHSGETCHLVWSRMLDDRSERGKCSREDRNENAEKNQKGDSERQNEE